MGKPKTILIRFEISELIQEELQIYADTRLDEIGNPLTIDKAARMLMRETLDTLMADTRAERVMRYRGNTSGGGWRSPDSPRARGVSG